MSAVADAGKLALFFVTTPARMRTARFRSFFERVAAGSLPRLTVPLALKRREPTRVAAADGSASMGWTPRCSEDEFESCAEALARWGAGGWINVEGEPREGDLRMLRSNPGIGALVSGHGLDPRDALSILRELPASNPTAFACENLPMLLEGGKILGALRSNPPTHVFIGSSYLSESSRVYDELGQERFRSIMRGLGKSALALGAMPVSTTSYCTFEPTGSGDRSKAFVAEQVRRVSGMAGWGTITRFYSHLETSDATRRTIQEGT